ncbi:MAG: Flp pilus assembly complex ATPase component TadA, partial [Planctomycetaceae bacterium]|nr:Flp pilus assembly complex ATPase component TadA [Planctomycetaceae bacterium]
MSNLTQTSEILELLQSTEIFADVDLIHWQDLCHLCEQREHKAGDLLFKQDDPSDGFGIVDSGELDVLHYDQDLGIERVLDRLSRGRVFGLMGLLLEQPRYVNVRAREPARSLYFPKQVFEKLVDRFPRVSLAIGRDMANRLATANRALGMQLEPLSNYQPTRDVIHALPLRMILRQKLLPLLLEKDRLTIGIVDPTDMVSRNMVSEYLPNTRINWVCISQPDFEEFRDSQLWDLMEQVAENLGGESKETLTYLGTAEGMEANSESAEVLDDVIRTAIQAGASDIHLEPMLKSVRVRTRIDGRLVKLQGDLDKESYPSLVSRIKVLAGLDIAIRRMPQDGGFALRFNNRGIDLRVSTLPTPAGESIVIRLLDREKRQLDFDSIFISDQVRTLVRRMFMQPSGLVLVTGPTGAGKTSTLYAGIRMRLKETPTIKMVTAEDPIEYHLADATQVQVNP